MHQTQHTTSLLHVPKTLQSYNNTLTHRPEKRAVTPYLHQPSHTCRLHSRASRPKQQLRVLPEAGTKQAIPHKPGADCSSHCWRGNLVPSSSFIPQPLANHLQMWALVMAKCRQVGLASLLCPWCSIKDHPRDLG